MIPNLIIRLNRDTVEVLSSHHLDGDHTYQQHIDPILELKSPLRVKPKGRPLGAKNKKRSQTEAGLDDSTCRELSRFKYEEEKNNSKEALVKKSDLSKKQKKYQGKKHHTGSSQGKGGKKSKTLACASEIPSVEFEEEEESDLTLDARSSKIDRGTIRSIAMSTQNTLRE